MALPNKAMELKVQLVNRLAKMKRKARPELPCNSSPALYDQESGARHLGVGRVACRSDTLLWVCLV